MKILVTGGAGFIGGHLVGRLTAEGHELLVIDDLSTGSVENLPPSARLLECDFAAPAALAALAAFRPAALVHLAAQIDAAATVLAPLSHARTNVLSTLELLESCRALDARPRFVFASSAAVYPEGVPLPAREAAAGSPATPYGVAKLASCVWRALTSRTSVLRASPTKRKSRLSNQGSYYRYKEQFNFLC